MDKIVPSILYNLQESDEEEYTSKSGRSKSVFDGPFTDETIHEETPKNLADRCLRELMGKVRSL